MSAQTLAELRAQIDAAKIVAMDNFDKARRTIESLPVACRIGKRVYPFTSYEQASKAYCAARDAIGATSSDERFGPVAPKCEIIDANGNCVAFISYNGKVWKGKLDNTDYLKLYSPYDPVQS